jgi:hypothetical protein
MSFLPNSGDRSRARIPQGRQDRDLDFMRVRLDDRMKIGTAKRGCHSATRTQRDEHIAAP